MATKTRGNNEGSIFQRKDGRWAGRISLGYDTLTGKRLQKTFYGPTRSDVQRQLTVLLAAKQKGLTVVQRDQRLGAFLDYWLEEVARPKVRASTYRSYEQIVRNHLKPGLGNYTLHKLTPQILQHAFNERAKLGISVEHLRRVLRSALSHAMRCDLVGRNVATLVTVPKKKKAESVFLSSSEALSLVKAADGNKYEALITLAVFSGLRIGEMLGLTWDDISMAENSVRVTKQLTFLGGKAELTETKTDKSRRTVAVPPFVTEALRRHRSGQLEDKIRDLGSWEDHNLVFSTRNGKPLDSRNVRRSLTNVLKQAGMPPMRIHDLRHSAASIMLEHGADLRLIMETLGHSQIAVTANTYTHVAKRLQRNVADKLQAQYEISL